MPAPTGGCIVLDMVIKSVVESDLSGKQGAATFTFGVGDTQYEIDLTKEEREEFENYLRGYVRKGRKATPANAKKPLVPETTPEERVAIRKWGRDNGFSVPEYGKIPKEVQRAYDEAHGIEREIP